MGNTDARAASEALIENPEVVAVVGGLSGTSVRTIQPILGEASILFVSPADVAPEHTRGADPAAPLRPYVSYFRTAVAAEDVIDTAANYAVDGLDAQKVVIIDGGASYMPLDSPPRYRRLGADVVATTPPNADWERIQHVVESADAAKVDVIYTTGDAEVAAQVARTLAGTGLEATLVGGVDLRSEDFVTAAGTAADGAVAVVDPQRVETSTGGRRLVARLGDHGVDAPGSYARRPMTPALAAALRRCLPGEETAAAAARKVCPRWRRSPSPVSPGGCLRCLRRSDRGPPTGLRGPRRCMERGGSSLIRLRYRDTRQVTVSSQPVPTGSRGCAVRVAGLRFQFYQGYVRSARGGPAQEKEIT